MDKALVYFQCAYYFHWTPEQVDNIECYLLEVLLNALPYWEKKVKESMFGGK